MVTTGPASRDRAERRAERRVVVWWCVVCGVWCVVCGGVCGVWCGGVVDEAEELIIVRS